MSAAAQPSTTAPVLHSAGSSFEESLPCPRLGISPAPFVPKRDYHIPQTDGSRESCPPSHVTCAHHPNYCQMDRRMRSRSDSNDLHATGDSAHPSASIGFMIHPSSPYALALSNSLSKLGRIGWFQASPIKIRGAIRAKAFSH